MCHFKVNSADRRKSRATIKRSTRNFVEENEIFQNESSGIVMFQIVGVGVWKNGRSSYEEGTVFRVSQSG